MKTFTGAAVVLAGLAASATVDASRCRALPGDPQWPNEAAWAKLNSTVRGRLIATVPIGSVCHDPNYDAAACAALKEKWMQPVTQFVLAPPCTGPGAKRLTYLQLGLVVVGHAVVLRQPEL